MRVLMKHRLSAAFRASPDQSQQADESEQTSFARLFHNGTAIPNDSIRKSKNKREGAVIRCKQRPRKGAKPPPLRSRRTDADGQTQRFVRLRPRGRAALQIPA